MLSSGIPVATLLDDPVSVERKLSFAAAKDLIRAWELGLFYLKTPDDLDLESARQFGRKLIASDSPHRQVPHYGELERFIAL